jgi:ubiquitin C-terminal hydrolase
MLVTISSYFDSFCEAIIDFFSSERPSPISHTERQVVVRSQEPSITQVALPALSGGMHNSGNSCYMASTLQALFRTNFMMQWLLDKQKESNETAIFLCEALKKTHGIGGQKIKTISSDKTKAIGRVFCEHGWNSKLGAEADAAEFLEHVMQKLELPCFAVTKKQNTPTRKPTEHLLTALVQEETSLKRFLKNKKIRLDCRHIPELLPIVIKRKLESDVPFTASRTITLPCTGELADKSIKYTLKSAIIYTGQGLKNAHYYSLVEHENSSWICYDDETVEALTSEKANDILTSSAYVCLYTKNS